jgi:hypothetical protein
VQRHVTGNDNPRDLLALHRAEAPAVGRAVEMIPLEPILAVGEPALSGDGDDALDDLTLGGARDDDLAAPRLTAAKAPHRQNVTVLHRRRHGVARRAHGYHPSQEHPEQHDGENADRERSLHRRGMLTERSR